MSAPPAVYVVGAAPGHAEVVQELESHAQVEIVGTGKAGGADALATIYADVVLLASAEPGSIAHELAQIRERTTAPVILLAPASTPQVLEAALAAGLDDALLVPAPVESVVYSIRKALANRSADVDGRRQGLVVTVFSPKGGTGKSVTAVNLAVGLAACEGRRTLLVDLDLQFGDAAVMLGLEPPQTIHDLIAAPGDLDPEKLSGFVCAHDSGLEMVAAPERPEEADLIAPARIGRLIEVAAESYEIVVVDTSPFVNGAFLAALDQSDVLLIVATPEVTTLKDVRQSLEMLELIRFPQERIELVLNRATAKVGITRGDVEAALGVRMRHTLPSSVVVPLTVNRGRPAALSEPRSDFARAARAIAHDLAARRPIRMRSAAVGGR